jgi:hypothetical protein
MQSLIPNMFKQSKTTLNRDRSKDLLIISQCEAFKHGIHPLIMNIISMLIITLVK